MTNPAATPKPPLNVAIQSLQTFMADLPPDTRTTLARLVYDVSVGAVGATNMAIEELMPNIPFVRGGLVKVTDSAADGVEQTLATMLEQRLEAGS